MLGKFRLVEFAARRGLLRGHAASDDFRLRVIFAANGSTGKSPQQRELAYVCERIRNRALKEFFGWAGERSIGGEIIVERFYGSEKAFGAFVPS